MDRASGERCGPVDRFPALRESKLRLQLITRRRGDVADLVATIEADPALTIAALRLANRGQAAGSVASVQGAVESLPSAALGKLADACPTFDFFGPSRGVPRDERFRMHALAVQRLAARVAVSARRRDADAIVAAASLHDVGKLVLNERFSTYHEHLSPHATPEERVQRERELFGVDHTGCGGALARSWGLPAALCEAIEAHHDHRPQRIAAVVAAADMLAHFAAGSPIDFERLAEVAALASLNGNALRAILYELPNPMPLRHGADGPCPLSPRELEIVRALRRGKVGKQIALELGLSESTIRSHLHRIYGRLGVADRVQAVFTASEHGWL